MSAFDPQVTIDWIESVGMTSSLMVGPANRMLRYAGTPEVCPRPPTVTERLTYESRINAAWGPPQVDLSGGLDLPTPLEKGICDLLDSPIGGAAAGWTLTSLSELASRGRFAAEDFLPLVIAAAGKTCTRWLPQVTNAWDEFTG